MCSSGEPGRPGGAYDGLDADSDAFIPLFPDIHAYNRLGNIDLFGGPSVANGGSGVIGPSNIMDINFGYSYMSGANMFGVAVHNLTLDEEVAAGAGMEDDIGNEVDLIYTRRYSDNVNFEVGVGQLLVGDLLDALDATGSADDVFRSWIQLDLTWGK